jgi:hypothetical protein
MMLRHLLAVLALVLVHSRLDAATCDVNYTGPSNGVWNAAGNWSTSALPTGGQTVCIPTGKGTITIGAGVAALAKDITAASGLAIVATGSLAISDATALTYPNVVADLSIAAGGTLSSAGSGVSIAGQALVDGMFSARAQLVSGSLSGTGTIGGFFDNKAGTVRPGGAGVVGTLSFGNMFDQESTGTLEIDLASDVSFDQINTPLNNDFVDGTIVVKLLGGYTPVDGTAWAFIPPNGPGTQITAHATPSTFTAHSISMGAELDFHAPDNATTTTTTAGAGVTTTTSTTAPASTPTTTTSHASTTQPAVTTTTVPGGCDGPSAATFASIDCRLDALIAQLSTTPDVPAKLKAALGKNLQKARDKKLQAEHATTVTRAVLGELKQARRKMIGFSHRIRSLASRRAIQGDTGPLLAAAGDGISSDLKTLRDSLRSAGKGKVRATNP